MPAYGASHGAAHGAAYGAAYGATHGAPHGAAYGAAHGAAYGATHGAAYGAASPPAAGPGAGYPGSGGYVGSGISAALDLLDDLACNDDTNAAKLTTGSALANTSYWDPLADPDERNAAPAGGRRQPLHSFNAPRPQVAAEAPVKDEWDPFADPADEEGQADPADEDFVDPVSAFWESRRARKPKADQHIEGAASDDGAAGLDERAAVAPVSRVLEREAEEEVAAQRYQSPKEVFLQSMQSSRSQTPAWTPPAVGPQAQPKLRPRVPRSMFSIPIEAAPEEEVTAGSVPSLEEFLSRIDQDERQSTAAFSSTCAPASSSRAASPPPKPPAGSRIFSEDSMQPPTPALEEILAMVDAEEAQEVHGTRSGARNGEMPESRDEVLRLGHPNEDLGTASVSGTVGSLDNVGSFGAGGTVAKLLQRAEPGQLEDIQRLQAEVAMDDERAKLWCPRSATNDGRRPPQGLHRGVAKWGGEHRAKAPAALPPTALGARRAPAGIGPRMAEQPRGGR